MDVIRDAKGMPSRRRYFKSDGSIIAEAKWAIESANTKECYKHLQVQDSSSQCFVTILLSNCYTSQTLYMQ